MSEIRITLDEDNQPYCPADYPHEPHSDAVWYDWQTSEVWDCSGKAPMTEHKHEEYNGGILCACECDECLDPISHRCICRHCKCHTESIEV